MCFRFGTSERLAERVSVYLSIYLSIYLSTYVLSYLSIYLSIYLFSHISPSLYVYRLAYKCRCIVYGLEISGLARKIRGSGKVRDSLFGVQG